MIKIKFEMETVHGKYRDAILLPENHGLTDADIEDLKQKRFSLWEAYINSADVISDEPQE